MWFTKFQNFKDNDLLILGYVYSFISLIFGGFLMINGYMFYSRLGIYAPIIGLEFYKAGFCIGTIGCLLIISSIYGTMALKEKSLRLLQIYSYLTMFISFSVALVCISGYYFTRIPDLCSENVGVYGRMYNYFMSDNKSYDAYLMKEMQKDFNCCGIDSIKDYYKKRYMSRNRYIEIPQSCYPENTCSIERFSNLENGCFHKISFYINRNAYTNALIGFIIYLISALGISILNTINLFMRQSSLEIN